MAFLSLRNSNNVVVTVSIDFPSNPKRDAFFHHKTYDYFLADLDCRRDLGDVPWKDIFKLVNFVSEYRLKLMYISPIANIGSNLNHLLGF